MAVVKRSLPSAPPVKTAKVAIAAPAFALPTAPSSPATGLGEYSWLLFGEKKIGKTSLAAEFPDALFLMTEPGAKALSVFQVPIISWTQLVEASTMLVSDTRFKTVVVDTVDIAFKMCERVVCARMNIDHPSDEDWGKGWSAVRDEFTAWCQRMTSLNKGVIFISHAIEREVKRRDGVKYDRFQPTMSGQARDVIEGMVDIWAYYTYNGQRRAITLRGDEHIMAGHRLQKNFRWKGEEVRQIDMGVTARQGYERLVAAFSNQYDPDTRTVVGSAGAPASTASKVKKPAKR